MLTLTESMRDQAVRIADEAMTELLRSHAVNMTAANQFSLCNDSGQEVGTMDRADPAIQDAAAWLCARGLAEIRADADGEIVVLVVDGPGSDSLASCVGCGCDDMRACCGDAEDDEPCSWLRLDRDLGLGVCSACPDEAAGWDAKRATGRSAQSSALS